MYKFSIINFVLASIPEQFFMVLFAASLLGKRNNINLLNIIKASLLLSILFEAIRYILYLNLSIFGILQLITFAFVIFFTFKIGHAEAAAVTLMTAIITAGIQSASFALGLNTLGYTWQDLIKVKWLTVVLAIPEYIVLCVLSFIFYRNGKGIIAIQSNWVKLFHNNPKIKYQTIQIILSFLIILFNYKLFLFDWKVNSANSRVLFISNVIVIILFMIFSILSLYRILDNIKKEEMHKRSLIGNEVIQNIHYLDGLLEEGKITEARYVIETIKDSICETMIKNIQPGGGEEQ